MEFPRPTNSPHIWLLLTARLEGGAAPGPIFTGGETETCVSGSQAPAFTRIPGASAAEPESPSQRRALRHRLSASSEPLAFVCSASRITQGLPAPTTPSVSLTPEAQPPACWERGRRRCLPLAVGARAYRPGRSLIGHAGQPSVFESAAGGRVPGLRASCSLFFVPWPAGKAAGSRARGSVPSSGHCGVRWTPVDVYPR